MLHPQLKTVDQVFDTHTRPSQVPLIAVSAWLSKRFGWRWGNLLLWASLILGQPLCILVYFYDYAVVNLDLNTL